MARRKPIRYLNGNGWQVLHDPPHRWIDCDSQEDAVLIAEAEALCKEVFHGLTGSEEIAIRLDAMADAATRNIGGGALVRYIQHAAKRARGASA